MTRRHVAVALVVLSMATISFALSTGQVIVANVDGPPVWVDVAGLSRITSTCPGTQTVNVPLLRIIARDVVVRDARNGTILRKTTVSWDIVVLVRRDLVLTGPPGSSYGPAPVEGCLPA
ncbi:MAG TPA: hypothetical protein VEM94_11245 [Candidatus Dormibacteraeota bacterium]|nr:hypothetical protein [Candidatus Dormibacteraeota bacterium]